MATAGSNAFDSLRGWVTKNSGTTPPNTGVSQAAEDLLRRPAQPFANTAPNPVTPNMPEYHGDGRYGAPANGVSNGQPNIPGEAGGPSSVGQKPPLGASPAGGTGVGNGSAATAENSVGRLRGAVNATKNFFTAGESAGSVGGALRNVAGDLTSLGGKALNVGGKLAAPLAAADAAYTGYNTGTDQYANRLGLQQPDSLAGDLGVRALGVATDVGNTMTMGGLRWAHDKMFGEGHWDGKSTPSASAPAPVKPSNGVTLPPTGAGAGQGSANFNDPRRLDKDPSRPDLGPSRDFTNELNKVPANLPSDLREGVIVKTIDPVTGRTTYSGKNVSARADGTTQMVDGVGRDLTPKGSVRTASGAPVFGPNGSYAFDVNAPTGANKQAAIDAGLRGPAGTKMTPQDVAIMAANQRDGVDLYRGTSQDPALRGGGTGGAMDVDRLMALASQPVGTPGRAAAKLALQQQMSNDGSLRVAKMQQDTTLQSKKWEMEVAQAQRDAVARASQMAGNDPAKTAEILSNAGYVDAAKHFSDMANQAQTREKGAQDLGTTARENAKKEFRVYDSKDSSKVDEAASQQAFDAVRQIFPGIDSADEATRNKFMSDAKEMHGIFQKARNQDKVGWDAMKFWEPKRPALSAMPDLRGGKTEQIGPFDGLVTLNASNGDTVVKRKDGTSLNLGQLTSRQRELVEQAKKSGWGK